MGKSRILFTGDGSTTLFDEKTGDNYHSFHGAETESTYVFIDKGLSFISGYKDSIRILEVGMGTGLNLCLTYDFLRKSEIKEVDYVALEPFPIGMKEASSLKFNFFEDEVLRTFFESLHQAPWHTKLVAQHGFAFTKLQNTLQSHHDEKGFDLIYYDAFGPTYQPEMWERETLFKTISMLRKGGVLVSYCAQGKFRRMLQEFGLQVERLAGPPGKREMLRGVLPQNL